MAILEANLTRPRMEKIGWLIITLVHHVPVDGAFLPGSAEAGGGLLLILGIMFRPGLLLYAIHNGHG